MSQRFSRHNIIGSEAGRPRPMAYLRPSWPRRRSGRPRALVLLAAVMLAGLALAGWLAR